MSAIDADFERASRALKSWELRSSTEKQPLTLVDDLVKDDDRFLDFYSEAGLKKAVERYGLRSQLDAIGLGDFEIVLGREDAFHHRLQAFAGAGRSEEDRILDLRVHLRRIHIGEQDFDAVGVDWLAMQNPRATFLGNQAGHARLPGQMHPGTHLGRAVHNLLLIMTERIGREALVATPERWHLARLYMRGGYRFARPALNHEVSEVGACTRHLTFSAAAWAVERAFVKHAKTGAPYLYAPEAVFLPLTARLKVRARVAMARLVEAARRVTPSTFVVDDEGLKQSLVDDPVEGLDANQIRQRWF